MSVWNPKLQPRAVTTWAVLSDITCHSSLTTHRKCAWDSGYCFYKTFMPSFLLIRLPPQNTPLGQSCNWPHSSECILPQRGERGRGCGSAAMPQGVTAAQPKRMSHDARLCAEFQIKVASLWCFLQEISPCSTSLSIQLDASKEVVQNKFCFIINTKINFFPLIPHLTEHLSMEFSSLDLLPWAIKDGLSHPSKPSPNGTWAKAATLWVNSLSVVAGGRALLRAEPPPCICACSS